MPPAFPVGVIVDDFNRANESPAINWLTVGDASTRVSGNEWSTTATNATDNVYAWNAATYGPDVDASVLWGSYGGSGSYWGVCLFVASSIPGSSTRDGYEVSYNIDIGQLSLWRIDNGVYTQLGSDYFPSSFGVGDSMGIRRLGSTVEAYLKIGAGSWTSVISAIDSTYQVTMKGGLISHWDKNSGGIGLDNFRIGSLWNIVAAGGSYATLGTAATLRSGSPTYLRHRK